VRRSEQLCSYTCRNYDMTCERIVLQDVLQLCCVLFSCPLVKRSTKLNFWTKITNYITDKWKYRRLHLRSQILSIILGLRSSQLLLRGILPYEIWCIAVLWESTKISEEHIYSIFRIEDSAKKKKNSIEACSRQSRGTRPPSKPDIFCGSPTALLQAQLDCHCSVA
jgi:hypothetical protein